MKKIILTMVIASVTMLYCNMIVAQITISGNAYLEHKNNYQNIKIDFVRTAPSSLTYTFYTDLNGHYTGSIQTGVYNIFYSKTGYYTDTIKSKQLFSSSTIIDVTLQISLCGNLFDTIYPGTYKVNCNIGVANNDKLIIQPGVKLQFTENISFNINGLLIAKGTVQDSIIFTQYNSGKSWSGLKFNDISNDSSTISYCHIEQSNNSGIYCYKSSPRILNSIITNNSHNKHGAGIYCDNSNPKIDNVKITFNSIGSSGSSGGGMYCVNKSNPNLTNVILSNNNIYFDYGAGICCDSNSCPTLNNVIIKDNKIISGSGGGIACLNLSNPNLNNVTIDGNSNNGYGGGMFCSNTSPILNNVVINNNTAYYGGGFSTYTDISNPVLRNVTITQNSAKNAGGGIWGHPTLINVIIKNNKATSTSSRGGGIYGSGANLTNIIIDGNSAVTGGGLYTETKINIENSTIINNTASDGGGAYCYNSPNTIFTNLIISNNSASKTGGGISCFGTAPNINFCNVWNNTNGNFYNCGTWIGVNVTKNVNGSNCDMYNNIQEDPMFENAGSKNYHLHPGSPCIDAGINDSIKELTDIVGQARIWDGDKNGTSIVDIGAYEVGISLGNDITACGSAVLPADAGFANYNWNNGLSNNDTLIVKTSGKYSVAVTNSKGLISYDTINATINPLPKINFGTDTSTCSTITLDAGKNFTKYKWNDASTNRYLNVTSSGKYIVTVTDNNACSNADTINVTVNSPFHYSDIQKLCGSDSLLWHGKYYKKSGQYFANYTTINSCDSIYELTLTSTTVDTAVVQDGIKLIANVTSASYQWIKCISNDTLTGGKSKEFIAKENGNYAVIITQNECKDTSSCFNIFSVGLNNQADLNSIVIYPNPTSGIISINGKGLELIEITNIQGQIIQEIKTSKEKYNIDLSSYLKGIYLIKVVTNQEIINRQIILK